MIFFSLTPFFKSGRPARKWQGTTNHSTPNLPRLPTSPSPKSAIMNELPLFERSCISSNVEYGFVAALGQPQAMPPRSLNSKRGDGCDETGTFEEQQTSPWTVDINSIDKGQVEGNTSPWRQALSLQLLASALTSPWLYRLHLTAPGQAVACRTGQFARAGLQLYPALIDHP